MTSPAWAPGPAERLPDDAPIARAGSPVRVPTSSDGGNPGRWAVDAVLAGAVVVSAWSIYRVTGNGEHPSLGGLTAADEVLVADIEALPADSLTAYALTELLRTGLAESPAISVVSRADQVQHHLAID